MRIRWGLVFTLMLVGPQAARAQTMCMLNTPASYQSRLGGKAQLGPIECGACSISNTNNFGGQGSCTAIAGSTPSATTSSNLAGYGVQTAISSFMAGWQRGRELARQRAAQEAARQADLTRQQAENYRQNKQDYQAAKQQAVIEKQQAFERTKQDAANELKLDSVGNADPGFKRSNAETFGLKTGASEGAKDQADAAWERMMCRASIDVAAATAAIGRNWQEARFLRAQSARAARGQRLDVECPSNVPTIDAIKCSKHIGNEDVPVPCDEADDPVPFLFAQVDSSTHQEIARLDSIEQKYPKLAEQKQQVTQQIEIKKGATTKGCVTELCRQAEQELEQLKQQEQELNNALDQEKQARDALIRNREILQEIQKNPAGVQNFLQQKGKS